MKHIQVIPSYIYIYIYIFTGGVKDGTKNVSTNSQYNSWFKESMDQFLPVLINTTHHNVNLLNQVKWKFQDVAQLIKKW